ncbi:SsrA-binding protein SmpB [Sporosarcina jiandibaonis]|uniref:SsrA-binding protein SmpB n=1 Tax=Sporosarcina jiandibaonis TaxID=2715535 RepID=UPI001552C999|nr:SsrA-binding protein SmpB [Sporosarcina jiandibaonis]
MAKGKGNILARNRRANFDYAIEDTLEAGIVLQGTEIKSIRAGKVQLREAFVQIRNNEAWIVNMHISPYDQGNRFNHDPVRTRKLLLHRRQINQLMGKTQQQGYTIVPIQIHLKNGFAKVLVGVGKGKKHYDRREDLKQKEAKRDVARALKESQQY